MSRVGAYGVYAPSYLLQQGHMTPLYMFPFLNFKYHVFTHDKKCSNAPGAETKGRASEFPPPLPPSWRQFASKFVPYLKIVYTPLADYIYSTVAIKS